MTGSVMASATAQVAFMMALTARDKKVNASEYKKPNIDSLCS